MSSDLPSVPAGPRFAAEAIRGVIARSVAALVILFLVGPFWSVDRLEQMAHEFGDNPLSRLYAAPNADRITVVLVDDASLKALRQTWPLPWALWQERLALVACEHPAAIFFDVLFPLRADLVAAASAAAPTAPCPPAQGAPRAESPVYFAAVGDADQWAPMAPRERKLAIEWEGTPLAYPLQSTVAGEPQPTAAFALAKAYCGADGKGKAAGCDALPRGEEAAISMIPRWSAAIPAHQDEWNRSLDACQLHGEARWWEIALAVLLPPVHLPHEPQACRPFLTLNFTDLASANLDAGFSRAIEGRVVFFAQSIQGARDFVPAPLHRQLPGVYLHAAALENLMSSGQDVDRIEKTPTILFVTASVLAFHALQAAFAALAGRRRWLWRGLGGAATYAALALALRLLLHWPIGMVPEAALMITVAVYFGELSHEGHLHKLVAWMLGARGSPGQEEKA